MKDPSQNFLVIKMEKRVIEQLKKDKIYDYLKENSGLIKNLLRDPLYYETFKKIIKEKYNLRLTDKISNVLNDVELISGIINTIN